MIDDRRHNLPNSYSFRRGFRNWESDCHACKDYSSVQAVKNGCDTREALGEVATDDEFSPKNLLL